MGGVVKGFQTDCDPTGPLGDLTGKGDQSSGKVVHKDRTGLLGDLIGRGDQSSGKVVLLSSAEHRKPAHDHYKDAQGCSQVEQRVSLESTLQYRK